MSDPDFDHFCRLVRARSGLLLTNEKIYLVESRLGPVAKSVGLAGMRQLLAKLRLEDPDALIQRCVEAMATHESLFFRDSTPFEQLAEFILPELARSQPSDRPIRVWCAACSSGQEPYSIAILTQELGSRLGGRRVEIVATDMAEGILEKARRGLYSDFEVRRGLSPARLKRWFQPCGDGWEVSPNLAAMIDFKRHNLLDGVAGMGIFDVILCRNVLIYFEASQKAWVLEQVAQAMTPDGSLLLGSAESTFGLTDALMLSPGLRGVYRPRSGHAEAPRQACNA